MYGVTASVLCDWLKLREATVLEFPSGFWLTNKGEIFACGHALFQFWPMSAVQTYQGEEVIEIQRLGVAKIDKGV